MKENLNNPTWSNSNCNAIKFLITDPHFRKKNFTTQVGYELHNIYCVLV